MGNGILVLCEQEAGGFKKTAYELLGKALALGQGPVSALVVGATDHASTLGSYGAATVYTVGGDNTASYDTAVWTAAAAQALQASGASALLAPASAYAKDFMPRLAARIGAGLATEVTQIDADGGSLVGLRPVYAGKALVSVKVRSAVALFTVRPNSFPAPEPSGGSATVIAQTVDVGRSLTLVKAETAAAKVVDLTEASRIVSGGRSLKSEENFQKVIVPLAQAIHATPGASRAAVDAGYAPHSWQVGQTGKVVNPTLYIACGISGAIQHLAGMRTSKIIVAINKDADAPIFQHATYGVVDDLFEVCPALQGAFEKALG